jgi:hypothetical protein
MRRKLGGKRPAVKKSLIKLSKTVAITWLALSAGLGHALVQRVDNFVLLDHAGVAHELYYERDARAIVLIVQGNGCKVVHRELDAYKSLRDDYAARGVRVLMINSNPADDRAAIAAEAAAQNIDIPILYDSAQIIGRSLELNRTAEVLVINPVNWEIVYRGALRGNVDSGAEEKTSGEPLVRNVLDQLVAGQTVAYQQVTSPGCDINLAATEDEQTISYAEDIVPILDKNCLACHVEGGIGPWAMSEYRMVQGFAPMMREVIRTKRMPPWHADPEVGDWSSDAGMSDEETRILVSWIEDGAPRGEGEDPLTVLAQPKPRWPLGEPDLVLDAPAFDVPATGVVDYQFPVIENPLDRDVWVVAASVLPGDTKVVHHVLMGSAEQAPKENDRESVFENYIMGYAPGNESAHMPEGTGVFVPVGGVYQLQMHYTPTGKATTDRTKIGLYFAEEPPANFLRQQVVVNPALKIPPNVGDHEESAYFEFWDDAVIYSLVPHSHYRGRSSTFELEYPDGRSELILSVPNYDFNWQRTYRFTEPRQVPKGTKIIHRTVYDNSVKNPGNPDPEREVPWGLQSHDEMLYGSVSYAWVNERSDAPLHSRLTSDTAQWMGFMDKNMDGRVSKDEMPEGLRDSIGWWKWWLIDTDFSGGLDLSEMETLVERLNEG